MKLRNKLSCINPVILLVLIWMGGGCSVRTSAPAAGEIAVKQLDDRLRVEIDGELFTEYLFCVKNRPIMYPVVGPHGIGMTRNFPMKKNVPGEQQDHPWHTLAGKRDQLFYPAAGCRPH
ncbi:MAG: hypothetical protein ACYTE5_12455 [Planctomycetota bacterium]